MDLQSLTDGLALFKSGMDGLRGALDTWRAVRGTVAPEKQAEVDKAIELSEKQLRLAEAQIAKGLGYELCHCQFPPTPMLTVGMIERGTPRPVHCCPVCGITDNGGPNYSSTADIAARRSLRAKVEPSGSECGPG